jgi:NADPH-dependent F420 reductase
MVGPAKGDPRPHYVPDIPLPLPRQARVGILGDNDLADALAEAFNDGGRSVMRIEIAMPEHGEASPLAARIDVVFVTIPWEQLRDILKVLGRALASVTVVNCASAILSDDHGFFMERLSEGSVTAALAAAWPRSRVVGALNQLTADHLRLAAVGALETDIPVIGDDREAADLVEALIDVFYGLQPVYAGPLRNAGAVEGLTALLREVESRIGHPVGFRLTEDRGLRILD